jgi:phosphoribosylaminoimidazolecarboxamide formyltransferase/IMP cyclohydrolase
MLRASAKNFHSVYSVIDPNDYNDVLSCLKINQESEEVLTFKRKLSAKVFAHTAAYDLAIAEYTSAEYLSTEHLANNVPSKSEAGDASSNQAMPRYTGFVLKQAQSLRYGENPHQSASSYVPLSASVSPDGGLSFVRQLQGKELSYNNLNDFSATISLGLDLFNQNRNKYQSVIVKHANPCGVSHGSNLLESFEGALSCDPVSAFGGVIFFSHELDLQTATLVSEAFYEIIIAPKISSDAKVILSKKKNLRVLEVDYELATSELKKGSSFKSILGSFLVQTKDSLITRMNDVDWVSGSEFQGTEKEDAELSWTTVKHVTSNAITIASGGKIIGVGAGQMNRLDSSKIAVERAKRFGFSTKGAVVSSDAFFPFPDSIEVFKDAEVGLIIQPGGSVRDQEVFDAAKEFGIKMICTGRRHFKH